MWRARKEEVAAMVFAPLMQQERRICNQESSSGEINNRSAGACSRLAVNGACSVADGFLLLLSYQPRGASLRTPVPFRLKTYSGGSMSGIESFGYCLPSNLLTTSCPKMPVLRPIRKFPLVRNKIQCLYHYMPKTDSSPNKNAQRKEESRIIRDFIGTLIKDGKAKEFLVEHGFAKKSGGLTKRYGG
jgi:hypothetical protein